MDTFEEIEEHLDFIESFRDFRREERIALTKFIQAYKELPVLWNKANKSFNNKHMKDYAYKELAAISKQLNPNAGTVEWVKNKITGLRAVFFRDYKKVVDTMRSEGPIYSPKLWYFGLMLFITEVDKQHIALSNKIRKELNLKMSDNFTIDSDIEISGLITEKEKTEYRQAMTEFISIYEAHPCLWNSHDTKAHCDKELKAKAHNELVAHAQKHFPGADLEWVKAKIYKLRAVFWREYKKKEKALAAGENYTPSLWYYDQMFFVTQTTVKENNDSSGAEDLAGENLLDDLCDDSGEPLKYNYAEDCMDDFELARAALDSADPNWDLVESPSHCKINLPDDKININDLLNTDSSQSLEPSTTSNSITIKAPSRKRKKVEVEETQPVMIHLPEINNTFGMDELNAFATSMAAKMRRMTQDQRDLAELEIGRILFLGLRGRLIDSTILPADVEQNYPDCTI